jgi:hypothetical protein
MGGRNKQPGYRRRRRIALGVLGSAMLALTIGVFPGQRLGMAWTLGTGCGRKDLQQRIDALEEKAISRAAFSDEERAFLSDFYRTLATGAKLSIVVAQTGRMMDHYLDGSGAPYQLQPDIFRDNDKVQTQLAALRRRVAQGPCRSQRLESPEFYMPDATKLDSVFGLYYGKVALSRAATPSAGCTTHVHAEVPWFWPSYASLRHKHGSAHAESFPLPNLVSLLLGSKHALFVDNGLGQYLVELGLARPFLAYAEWDE